MTSIYAVSAAATAHIEQNEGFRAIAYQDGGDQWTIGYGTSFFPDGTAVKEGDTISQADALKALTVGVQQRLDAVTPHITVALNQNQVDAIADFVYNIGEEDFLTSHFLIYLNQGNYSLAAGQFDLWIHDAKGNVEPGLVTRRAYDKTLFLTPVASFAGVTGGAVSFDDSLAGAPQRG